MVIDWTGYFKFSNDTGCDIIINVHLMNMDRTLYLTLAENIIFRKLQNLLTDWAIKQTQKISNYADLCIQIQFCEKL